MVQPNVQTLQCHAAGLQPDLNAGLDRQAASDWHVTRSCTPCFKSSIGLSALQLVTAHKKNALHNLHLVLHIVLFELTALLHLTQPEIACTAAGLQ